MKIRTGQPLAAIAVITAALLAGLLVAFTAHSIAASADEEAIKQAAINDQLMSVAPWIPCNNGQATGFDAATVAAQQAKLASLAEQTYAPTEPSHANMVVHLKGLVNAHSHDASDASGGNAICTVSGGVDQVQVLGFTQTGTTAQITIQAHIWNEKLECRMGNCSITSLSLSSRRQMKRPMSMGSGSFPIAAHRTL